MIRIAVRRSAVLPSGARFCASVLHDGRPLTHVDATGRDAAIRFAVEGARREIRLSREVRRGYWPSTAGT